MLFVRIIRIRCIVIHLNIYNARVKIGLYPHILDPHLLNADIVCIFIDLSAAPLTFDSIR
ncbi:hypothetical protein D3C78_1780250 [compost metagenome]